MHQLIVNLHKDGVNICSVRYRDKVTKWKKGNRNKQAVLVKQPVYYDFKK